VRAATAPRSPERLLLVDPARGTFDDATPRGLVRLLGPGDLLVVNDAATLPASLAGAVRGEPVEVRLLDGEGERFRAVLLGAGDWRTRTEHRPPPPPVTRGDEIELRASLPPPAERGEGRGGGRGCAEALKARVEGVSELSPRLVRLVFDRSGAELYRALYAVGRPIQYAHVASPLELWSVQTGYAARPWAVEMPSAGRPLSFELVLELRRRGVAFATLTHAAGLSATGDPAIDAALPLPERYEIPEPTIAAVERADRVIAVGTSVVRALEGAFARHGVLRPGRGETDLVLREGFEPRVVDALLTGMHEKDASHFALLQAFAPRALLESAYAHAEEAGYLGHEFGDATLILGAAA